MRRSLRLLSAVLILGVGACRTPGDAPPAAADLVILNGRVLTVDAAFTEAEAVAIRGDTIVAVGTTSSVRQLVGRGTRVIDAQGRSVVPGLIETHVHATGAARGEVRQPFVQLHSIVEIQDWIRARVRDAPAGAWIEVPRADVTRIRERRIPTRAELDAAAPETPVVFTWQYANRQVQILNTAALLAAGLTPRTAAPPGGRLHVDADGRLTGVVENASELFDRLLPDRTVTDDAYLDSLAALLRRYNEVGITSIVERASGPDGYRDFQRLRDEQRLPVRVTVTVRLDIGDGSESAIEQAIDALPFRSGEGDDRVRIGPLKISVDGGTLYGTALMRQPYPQSSHALYGIVDPGYRGEFRPGLTADAVRNYVRVGHRRGWQLSTHVTGDGGVDAVLDAVEAANADSPITDRRFTLIHAYFAHPDAAARAARLGVVVDTQPAWFYKDGDALLDALGSEYLDLFMGVQNWRRAGVAVALNSDHMQGVDPLGSLNPYSPMLAMGAAISRRTDSGQLIGADQRLSRGEALRMVTIDAARLTFDEDRRGSIEAGKLADLAILSDDFLAVDEARIKDLRSVLTIVGGEVVYEAEPQ